MAKSESPFQTLAHYPLTGMLDVRSRPADLPPGAFRWKQNFQVTPEGKLRRRAGFNRAFFSGQVTNHDYHAQGGTREIPSYLFESTDSAGDRRLYLGTESKIAVMNEGTGAWTTLITGMGATGSRWQAAQLQDVIVFTNGVDDVQFHTIGGGIGTNAELIGLGIRAAKVVVEFNGFILLMNLTLTTGRAPTTIEWCDMNKPGDWDLWVDPGDGSSADTLANYQDLAYEDEILAAAPLLGSLYIYTRRAIWKCTLNSDSNQVFSFSRIYYEPKNQKGCLLFPYTLVSTGEAHYYMSRDGIYRISPYLPTPEREDWLHRASAAIYDVTLDTGMDGTICHLPVSEYVPAAGELWFSWPSSGAEQNDYTLVAQVDHKTADIVDHGFAYFVNYRKTPTETLCNEAQYFLGVSTNDWCLKEIGGVFYRLLAAVGADLTVDLPDQVSYVSAGYDSILRGMIATQYFDRPKRVKRLRVEDDTVAESEPCKLVVRIGNSETLADPNNESTNCPVQWHSTPSVLLECHETKTPAQMAAQNLRPSAGKDFPCYRTGNYLYFEITITNQDDTEAIGGDSCFAQLLFDVALLPKP